MFHSYHLWEISRKSCSHFLSNTSICEEVRRGPSLSFGTNWENFDGEQQASGVQLMDGQSEAAGVANELDADSVRFARFSSHRKFLAEFEHGVGILLLFL